MHYASLRIGFASKIDNVIALPSGTIVFLELSDDSTCTHTEIGYIRVITEGKKHISDAYFL